MSLRPSSAGDHDQLVFFSHLTSHIGAVIHQLLRTTIFTKHTQTNKQTNKQTKHNEYNGSVVVHIPALVMVATAPRQLLCLFTVGIAAVVIVASRVRRGMQNNEDGGIGNNKQRGLFSAGDGDRPQRLS